MIVVRDHQRRASAIFLDGEETAALRDELDAVAVVVATPTRVYEDLSRMSDLPVLDELRQELEGGPRP